jgi:hypothetical protein
VLGGLRSKIASESVSSSQLSVAGLFTAGNKWSSSRGCVLLPLWISQPF